MAEPNGKNVGGRRMSDLEALLWYVDKDPYLSSNFGSVTLAASAPICRVQAAHAPSRLAHPAVPRVVPALGRMAPPEWKGRPRLRHRSPRPPTRPARTGPRAPAVRPGRLVRAGPDLSHRAAGGSSCWSTGSPGAGRDLLQKMHHTITDGEGGIRLSEQFIDPTPDAPDVDEVPIVTEAEHRGSLVGTATETLGTACTGAWVSRAIGRAGRRHGPVPDPPGHDGLRRGRDGGCSVLRQLTVTDQLHHGWNEPSLGRRLKVLDVSFDDARLAAKSLVAASTTSSSPRPPRPPAPTTVISGAPSTNCAWRCRSAPGRAGRRAATASCRPGCCADRRPRPGHPVLDGARVARGRTKHERAIGLMQGLAGMVNLLPTSVVVRIARQQAETVTSPPPTSGPRRSTSTSPGAHIEATYPIGYWRVRLQRHRDVLPGVVYIGLHLDSGLVTEPKLLRGPNPGRGLRRAPRRRLLTTAVRSSDPNARCRSFLSMHLHRGGHWST